MEALIAPLVFGLYVAKIALIVALAVAIKYIWIFAKEEWEEFMTYTRKEKKRLSAWDDEMFTKWCVEKKTWASESIRKSGNELTLRSAPRHAA
jgi:hypothetical protein